MMSFALFQKNYNAKNSEEYLGILQYYIYVKISCQMHLTEMDCVQYVLTLVLYYGILRKNSICVN